MADILTLAGVTMVVIAIYLLTSPAWALLVAGIFIATAGVLVASREEDGNAEPDETTNLPRT